MSKNKEVKDALSAPTPKERINFRVGFKNKSNTKACMLAYVDARFVMDRLDEAVGKENWSTEYDVVGNHLFCRLTIKWPDGSSTTKADCGMETEVDAEKGQVSDAFKRAAVHYGIGRDLYSMPQYWADLSNGYVERDWKPSGWDSSAQQDNSEPTTTSSQVTESQPPTNEAQEKIKKLAKQAEDRGEGQEVKPKSDLKQGTPPENEYVRIKNLHKVRESDKSYLLIPSSFKGDTGDFEATKPYWVPKSKIKDLVAMPSGKFNLDVERWIADQTLPSGEVKYEYEEIPQSKGSSANLSDEFKKHDLDDDDLPF